MRPFFQAALQRALIQENAHALSNLLFAAKKIISWRPEVPLESLLQALKWACRERLLKSLKYLCEDLAEVPEWNAKIKKAIPEFISRFTDTYGQRVFNVLLENLSPRKEWAQLVPTHHFVVAMESALINEDALSINALMAASKNFPQWGKALASEKYKEIFRALTKFGESTDVCYFLQVVDKSHPAYEIVNYELLEGLAIATFYHNRSSVEEILVAGKNDPMRQIAISTKLVEFLDSLLLEYENKNLVQLFVDEQQKHSQRLSDAYIFLTHYFQGYLKKNFRGLHDFLDLLALVDEKSFWRNEIVFSFLWHGRKEAEKTIRLILRNYGYDSGWVVSTTGILNQTPQKDIIARILPEAIFKAGQRRHETNLALLLHASGSAPTWRQAALTTVNNAVREFEKPNDAGIIRRVHNDVLFIAKKLQEADREDSQAS